MDSEENSYTAINQTYKIWKKNAPFLYSLLQTYELSSSSQTVEWFEGTLIGNDWRICDLLIGTNSTSQNELQIINVGIPSESSFTEYYSYKQQRSENGLGTNGFIGTMGQQQLSIKNSIRQTSEVMKARVNRFDKNIIAVKTGGANAEFIIYDLKHREEEVQNKCVKLEGHYQEGFGLAWSPHQSNLLLSGSYDKKILVYDLDNNKEAAEYEWQSLDGIEDVKWSNFNPSIFASAHQQQKINIWDIRSKEKAAATRKAHNGEVYSVDFNYMNQFLLLSAGEDGDVNLWDTRNISKKLHSFIGHNDAVNVVSWSPHNPLQFASGSSDRRTIVWDISKLNDGGHDKVGSEMLFIHGGHRSKVTDLSWNRENEYIIGSCEQNNILQVWKMSERITSNL